MKNLFFTRDTPHTPADAASGGPAPAPDDLRRGIVLRHAAGERSLVITQQRGRGTVPAEGSVVPCFSLHQFPERRSPRAEGGHLLGQKPRSAGLALAPVTSRRGLSPASSSRPFASIPPFRSKFVNYVNCDEEISLNVNFSM